MRDLIVGRAALLVIDMQHDFLDTDAPFGAPGMQGIVGRVGKLIRVARAAGVPIIYTQEAHRPNRIDSGRELDPGTGACYPGGAADSPVQEHCVEGTRGVEIVDALAPEEGDFTIIKRRYSCFLGTDLEILLGCLEVRTLFVTGVDSNVCVLWTVGEAFQRDYHVRVVEDCIAGTTRDQHNAAVMIMAALTGRTVTSADVVEALRAMPAEPAAA
jgi:nicotinamidase-related amidase